MNKKTIIDKIDKLELNKNDFWVLGSSALVLRGILEEANDIDLAITEELYNKLIKKHNLLFLGVNNNTKWYKIDEDIECCVEEFTSDKIDIVEPFNLLNLVYYYNNFIKDSTRPKDLEKKKILEDLLNKN